MLNLFYGIIHPREKEVEIKYFQTYSSIVVS